MQRDPAALLSVIPELVECTAVRPESKRPQDILSCRPPFRAPAVIQSVCPLEVDCVLGRRVGVTAQSSYHVAAAAAYTGEGDAQKADPDKGGCSLVSCAIRGMGRRQQNVEDSAVSTPQQVVTPWEIYKRRKGVAASLFPVLVGGLLLPLTRPPSAASHPIRNSSAAPSDGPHAGIC